MAETTERYVPFINSKWAIDNVRQDKLIPYQGNVADNSKEININSRNTGSLFKNNSIVPIKVKKDTNLMNKNLFDESVDSKTMFKLGTKNVTLSKLLDRVHDSCYLPKSNYTDANYFMKACKFYNRFKVANPNHALQRGFAHVFFVRPSCYILDRAGGKYKLRNGLSNDELFNFASHQKDNWLLRELTLNNGQSHDFMFFLSNYARSFSNQDEMIESDPYGKTFTGYKIMYGKNNIESKSAGEFTIQYLDDREFRVYQLHRLWVEYISRVYRGELTPAASSIIKRELDYSSAVYYIITAEDGETILFWTKYYGVFPTTIPSTQYSWAAGNTLNFDNVGNLEIRYVYSFKEDYNPYSILEFNYNAGIKNTNLIYEPVYDASLGQTGRTWVGTPFIEVCSDSTLDTYNLKLRFKRSTTT